MESQVIKKLLEKGKITTDDINEVMEELPSDFERDIIEDIKECYSNNSQPFEVWVTHFLPILRGVSQKINELSNPAT